MQLPEFVQGCMKAGDDNSGDVSLGDQLVVTLTINVIHDSVILKLQLQLAFRCLSHITHVILLLNKLCSYPSLCKVV